MIDSNSVIEAQYQCYC